MDPILFRVSRQFFIILIGSLDFSGDHPICAKHDGFTTANFGVLWPFLFCYSDIQGIPAHQISCGQAALANWVERFCSLADGKIWILEPDQLNQVLQCKLNLYSQESIMIKDRYDTLIGLDLSSWEPLHNWYPWCLAQQIFIYGTVLFSAPAIYWYYIVIWICKVNISEGYKKLLMLEFFLWLNTVM